MKELKKDFHNIYHYLNKISGNFKDKDILLLTTTKFANTLFRLDTKICKIRLCFELEEEKEIYRNYINSNQKLKNLKQIIGNDLKHLIIHNEFCKIKGVIGNFVTEDNLEKQKGIIESNLKNLNIISIEDYIRS